MNIKIVEFDEKVKSETISMITDFFNYHRMINDAPKEFWSTDEDSEKDLKEWLYDGDIYLIYDEDKIAGFIHLRFGGQSVAWLDDLFVKEGFRGRGIAKAVLEDIDKKMIDKGIITMFVSVVPRNIGAIKLYRDCGFDHLNMIELRKNYDKSLDKDEHINILGFDFKKY